MIYTATTTNNMLNKCTDRTMRPKFWGHALKLKTFLADNFRAHDK